MREDLSGAMRRARRGPLHMLRAAPVDARRTVRGSRKRCARTATVI
jgi:hypothetical protein